MPSGIRLAEVRDAIAAVPGVEGLHDLHVWSMSNQEVTGTVHVTLADGAAPDTVRVAVAAVLAEGFGVKHSTIQTEAPGALCGGGAPYHA